MSNVNVAQLRQVLALCRIRPHVVQIRTFGHTGWDDKVGGVRALCNEHSIRFEGCSLLTANRKLLQHATWRSVAKGRGDTSEQLAFRYSLQLGMMQLTGTTSTEHAAQDLGVVHGPQYAPASDGGPSFVPLSDAEMEQLNSLIGTLAQ